MPSKRLGALNYGKEGDPQSNSRKIFYISMFLLSLLYKSFSSLFSSLPFLRIFIFLLYLHTNFLHSTLEGLRWDS